MSLPQQKAKYIARACGAASLAHAKSSGNMQIALPFEISQGDFAGEVITWIGTFHGTADKSGVTGEERVISSLQYAGWQGDDLCELVGVSDDDIKRLLPDEVELACDVETYDGKVRLKVQWVNKPGSGRFAFKEQLEGGSLKSFAAQLKSTVRSVRATNGGSAPPRKPASNGSTSQQSRHPNAPPVDDDIPF